MEMIQDVFVEIQLHNSRKEYCKGMVYVTKGIQSEEETKFYCYGHFNFWGRFIMRLPMKCSGKPVAMGYLASCRTSDFFPQTNKNEM